MDIDDNQPEILLTFIVRLDMVVNKFKKSFKNHSEKIGIEHGVFSENSRNIKMYLSTIFKEIIFKSIRDLDGIPSVLKTMDFSFKEYFMDKRS
jgi:hypothetical protein